MRDNIFVSAEMPKMASRPAKWHFFMLQAVVETQTGLAQNLLTNKTQTT